MLWQAWWVWVAAGFVLGVLEMLAPGFILLGFAIGAVLTGVLLWFGTIGAGLPAVLLVFALGSLAGWLLLRYGFGRHGSERPKIIRHDINDN